MSDLYSGLGIGSGDGVALLSFVLDSEVFAVRIDHVREILDRTDVTRIPRMPDYMRGALNVRGSVVPVIDLRVKFGLGPADVTPDTCVVVVEVEVDGECAVLGAMVDAVRDVFEIGSDLLAPPPRMGAKLPTEFIEGVAPVDGDFMIVLDIDRVLSADEVIALRESTAGDEPSPPKRGSRAKGSTAS